MKKNLFDYRWGRALYQILIGILLIPYRLVALIIAVGAILMGPAAGVSLRDGAEATWDSVVTAYKQRAHWVRTGKVMYDYPEDEDIF